MGKADTLSRMTGLEMGEKDNENVVLPKPELFILNLTTENPQPHQKTKTNLDRYVQTCLDTKDKDWERTEDDLILFQELDLCP